MKLTNMHPSHMANGAEYRGSAHNLNKLQHTLAAPLRYSVGRCIIAGKRGNGSLVIYENSPDFLAVRDCKGHEIIAEYDIRDTGSPEGNRNAVKARFYRDHNPKKFGFQS
jgi:hypothetical protein